MKVLVTGAGAQIGGLLATRLVALGYQVVALGHRTPAPEALIGKAERIQADLAESLAHLPPVDGIVHGAARTPATADGAASDYVRSNIEGMERLIEYARRVGVKYLLNLSTISVYGQLPSGELTEDAPFYAPDIYGATKYVAERLLAASCADVPGLSLRLPGVLAPRNFGPWIGKTLRHALDGSPITIYNPQAPFNNVIDVEELARFSNHILKTQPASIGVVNWGADQPSTIRGVIDLILQGSNSRSLVTEGVAAKPSFWINTDRLRRQCRFQPAPTHEMVGRYVRATVGA